MTSLGSNWIKVLQETLDGSFQRSNFLKIYLKNEDSFYIFNEDFAQVFNGFGDFDDEDSIRECDKWFKKTNIIYKDDYVVFCNLYKGIEYYRINEAISHLYLLEKEITRVENADIEWIVGKSKYDEILERKERND